MHMLATETHAVVILCRASLATTELIISMKMGASVEITEIHLNLPLMKHEFVSSNTVATLYYITSVIGTYFAYL